MCVYDSICHMNKMYRCVFSVLCIAVFACDAVDVTVDTKVGTFIGFQEEVLLDDKNVTISKFLGIPYAEPPIGDLRFRKSVVKSSLPEPLEVKEFGSACFQFYFMFPTRETDSEDCLFLNIFKPEGAGSSEKLPVMVWIHGGGFSLGSSNEYIGDALAANGPVIFVSMNYRMTAWGFLTTDNKNAPGNYGLWDQHLAIKWVHENIEAFGGDNKRVTIFGQSAGSASVIYQGLYPGNKGLFQRIIAQSGSPAGAWARSGDGLADTVRLASALDCDTEDEDKMLECLRKVPGDKLNKTINDPNTLLFKIPMPFIPNVDGEFVTVAARDSLDMRNKEALDLQETFASFELMIGVNSGEGGSSVNPMTGVNVDQESFLPNKTFFDKTLVPTMLQFYFGENYNSIMEDIVISEYTDWSDPENPLSIREQFCNMHGDMNMVGSVDRAVKVHASLSNERTFYYLFDVLPYKGIFPRPTWYNRALHGDELFYMLGNKMFIDLPGMFEKREFQVWEKEASKNIMTLWTNFAKTGNPNEPRFVVNWKPYTPDNHRYLQISNDVTSSPLKERLRERQAMLVDVVLPGIDEIKTCDKNKYSEDVSCSKDGHCPKN